MIKNLNKLEIEKNFLNLIKNIYKKSTANIIFNGERLNAFPLRSETTQGVLTLSSQNCVGSFSHVNEARKRNKEH